jgi:NADH-quinone oxidoreductase subunit J
VAELVFIFGGWVAAPTTSGVLAAPTPALAQASNTQALGQLLYTQYFYLFQAAGMILLVSMIGAIVLTHRERVGVRRQRIATQLERGRDSVEIKNVPTGSGV